MSVTVLRETLERARSLIDQRYTPGEGKGISEITESTSGTTPVPAPR